MTVRPFRPDAAEERASGDMRDACLAVCHACGHRWWAPVVGLCPRCRAEGAEVVHRQELDYVRV